MDSTTQGSRTAAPRRDFLRTLGTGAVAATVASAASAQTTASGSAPRPVRVGVIGCGGRGSYLAGKVRELKTAGAAVEIVAVCDIYRSRVERLATQLGAQAYRRSADLLASSAVDAVIVATPDRSHVYESLAAVRAGKDVYCEKPLTHWQQFDQLKILLREVRQRSTVFQVGSQWVSNPMWTEAARHIRNGGLGKITHAQTGYFRHGDSGERGMPIDDAAAQAGPDLDWDTFLADAPKRPFDASRFFQWRMYLDYSGGPSTDLYPHPMTRLFKALGVGLPKKVVAVGGKYFFDGGRDTPDTFDMLIEYPGGMTVSVLGSITNDTPIDTVIRGTEGTLRFTGDSELIRTPQPGGKPGPGRFGHDTTVEDHLTDFLQCIATRAKPRADLELAYTVQVPLIMAMQSWAEGKVAWFEEAEEAIHLT